MDIGVDGDNLSDFLREDRVEEGKLVSDGGEDELDIAATSGACTEEARAKAVLAGAQAREGLGDSGFSCSGEATHPENERRLKYMKMCT